MKFGPYELRDIAQIESILKKISADYSIEVDKDAIKTGEKTFHEEYPHFNPGFKYQVRSTYIVINEENLKRVGNLLERFGIAEPKERGKKYNEFVSDSDEKPQAMPKKVISSNPRLLFFICFLLLIIGFLIYSWY